MDDKSGLNNTSSCLNLSYCLPAFNEEVQVWLALPPNLPSQKVEIKKITPPPLNIIKDGINELAFFKLKNREKILVEMRVARFEVKGPQLGAIEEKDLRETPFIKINKDVHNKANEIIGDCIDKKEQIRLIFQWIRDNIKYKYPTKVWGNLPALYLERGDCGGSSFLFASFCRALGIPSRVVFGRIITEDSKSTPHAWAEAYADGWITVDCSMAREAKKRLFSASDYFNISHDPNYFFGNLDKERLIFSIGTGLNPHVKYPEIETNKGYEVKTHNGTFLWGKELYQGKIPFLQPVYYSSKENKITQGKLTVQAPFFKKLVWKIKDPVVSKFCSLLIIFFLILSWFSSYGWYFLFATILGMLLVNIFRWHGNTKKLWISIFAAVLIVIILVLVLLF